MRYSLFAGGKRLSTHSGSRSMRCPDRPSHKRPAAMLNMAQAAERRSRISKSRIAVRLLRSSAFAGRQGMFMPVGSQAVAQQQTAPPEAANPLILAQWPFFPCLRSFCALWSGSIRVDAGPVLVRFRPRSGKSHFFVRFPADYHETLVLPLVSMIPALLVVRLVWRQVFRQPHLIPPPRPSVSDGFTGLASKVAPLPALDPGKAAALTGLEAFFVTAAGLFLFDGAIGHDGWDEPPVRPKHA